MPAVHEMLERDEAGNVVRTYVTSASASPEERGEATTEGKRVDIVVRCFLSSLLCSTITAFRVCVTLECARVTKCKEGWEAEPQKIG